MQQREDLKSAARMLLGDLFPTCDGEDRLQATTTRYWAEQALLLEKAGEDFEDTVEDCRFLAYITEQEKENVSSAAYFSSERSCRLRPCQCAWPFLIARKTIVAC